MFKDIPNDPILPEQWWGRLRQTTIPYANLYRAIILEAINTALVDLEFKYELNKDGKYARERERKVANDWIFSNNTGPNEPCLCFVDLCDIVGLDADEVRKRIRTMPIEQRRKLTIQRASNKKG